MIVVGRGKISGQKIFITNRTTHKSYLLFEKIVADHAIIIFALNVLVAAMNHMHKTDYIKI